MAEVRALPSGVGAYEAQVLNFSSVFNAIARQNALDRKEAAALRKQLEDNLNTTINDKRIIRSQDSDYINKLKTDVQEYFSENKSAIIRGGTQLNEFKKKMGLVTSEITRSLSIKENGVQLQNYAIKTMDPLKSTDVSKSFKDALAAYELPMNDARRKTFTFKNEIGQDVDVDQLTINELNRIAYFRPEELQESIISNVPKEKVDFMFPSKGKDFTRSYAVRSPYGVATSVVNQFVQKPDAKSFYQKAAAEELAMNPNFQQNVNNAYQHMIKMYANARSTTSGSGFGSVEYLFQEKDGQPGIDINNPYEFALFQSLYANLPQDLGITYDYRSQANYRANESLKDQKNNTYLRKLSFQQQNKPNTLDGIIIEDIKAGKLNPTEVTSAINTFISQKEASLGGLEPAKLSIDDKNKTMTAVTRRVLTDGTNAITDKISAEKYLTDNKLKGKIGATLGGAYYLEETRTISIDPNKNVNYTSEVPMLLDMVQDVQVNQTQYQTFQGLRQGRGRDILKNMNF